ncbi:hypothetical protein [Actinoplanes palleronii]|uniref:Uncharacterized protein n=1 Tax=Actinoplanes palleronii TaxID=113570 RepID=A0ABQ4BKB3_9ACTN|nr:hypothetical protein [Actinoplanes palleronii]GIE71122.1 hypothetical protein Apa02nite_072300 [Actinoplanes palleronii]
MTTAEAWSSDAGDTNDDADVGTYDDAEVATPHSPAQAGRDLDQSTHYVTVSGDQYQAQTIVFQQGEVAKEVTTILKKRLTTAQTLTEQVRRYVAPPGLGDHVSQLATGRSLVLLCPAAVPRSGQRAAAAFLIHRVDESRAAATRLNFQEPLLDKDDEATGTLRDAKNVGLFFDFVERGDGPEAVDSLRQFGLLEQGLAEAGAFAVLAVSDALTEEAEKSFPGRVHHLRRPAGEAVFRSRAAEIPTSLLDALTVHEVFRQRLREAWPPEATRLAKLANRAYQAGITDLDGIARQVVGALSNWQDQARKDMRQFGSAPQRALLLAAAMLEGSGPAAIVHGRDLLLRAGDFPAEPTNPLERTDVVTELEALHDIELNVTDTRFARFEYGIAVLHLAWQGFPGLHLVLLRWLERLPSVITPDGIDEFIARIIALSVRDGSGQIAVAVARRWANGRRPAPTQGTARRLDKAQRVAAVILLRDACLHPQIGGDVRRRVYEYAYYLKSPAAFRVVLAEAVGAFDVHHQTAAMTRLKHLARGPEEEVMTAVVRAGARLASEMELGRLLEYLGGWLSAANPRRTEVAVQVAMQVMTELDDTELRLGSTAAVTSFWRTALATLPSATATALIRCWIRLAATSEQNRSAAIHVLLGAAGTDLRRVGQLFYATRPTSEPGTEEEILNELFQQVRLRLDEVLTPGRDTGWED